MVNFIEPVLAALAIGLGIGDIALLSGSIAALGGVFIALALTPLRRRMQLVATVALVVFALLVCEVGVRKYKGDDSRIVADELLTFPVAVLALPIRRHPGLLVSAFVLSRTLDWLKLPPAASAERISGGAGVVLDDVVANLWTLLLMQLSWLWLKKRSAWF
ncbi:phosphatidylglycerophosphatase A [Pseudidiomarina salinarum]|uniref:phosphatidylglycerophosphatase A family protein n=1 Tax=Pseudidiomarina salinarum TaxID=435908 RepID=UPI00068B4DAC|nr:phosphatidylglycerophosphatase A [Pseudidiomarina salinarum]RUO71132.1 phosphatidylglycerophosphatase A [Pseudidiomarina salinarum]